MSKYPSYKSRRKKTLKKTIEPSVAKLERDEERGTHKVTEIK